MENSPPSRMNSVNKGRNLQNSKSAMAIMKNKGNANNVSLPQIEQGLSLEIDNPAGNYNDSASAMRNNSKSRRTGKVSILAGFKV